MMSFSCLEAERGKNQSALCNVSQLRRKQCAGSPCLGRVQKQDKTNSISSRNKEGMLFKLDIVCFVCSGLHECQVKQTEYKYCKYFPNIKPYTCKYKGFMVDYV